MTTESPSEILDLLIIGAGPHSLALLSRLFERTPSALYSEVEHARLHWLRQRALSRPSSRSKRVVPRAVVEGRQESSTVSSIDAKKIIADEEAEKRLIERRPKVVVCDKQKGEFLGTWDRFFEKLDIPHLRSPLFFHSHPGDVDALKSFAHEQGRSGELIEIAGVVGTEWSKHQRKTARIKGKAPRQPHINLRDADDYNAPSTSLFQSFNISQIIDRYSLSSYVEHHTIASLSYSSASPSSSLTAQHGLLTPPNSPPHSSSLALGADTDEEDPHFKIITTGGEVKRARAVVMSIGPGGIPSIPSYLTEERGVVEGEGWCHTAAFLKPNFEFPAPRAEGGTLLVIGGGLTSAQIVDLAIKKGYKKVILVCRSHLKIKPFDIGTEWMGKFGNLYKMMFYQEDSPEARLAQIRAARNGGSLPAPYHKLLKSHVASGHLDIRTLSSITSLSRSSLHSSSFESSTSSREGSGAWVVEVEKRTPRKVVSKTAGGGKRGRKVRKSGQAGVGGEEDGCLEDCGVEREDGEKAKAEMGEIVIDIEKETLQVDYIVSATGSRFDFESLPFLSDIYKSHPIKTMGGFPLLTDDLQWSSSLPLFVMGGYASLQLGPGAANLIGSREGSERIAHGLGVAFPAVWGEDASWRDDVDELDSPLCAQSDEAAEADGSLKLGGDGKKPRGRRGRDWMSERRGTNGNFWDGLEEEIE